MNKKLLSVAALLISGFAAYSQVGIGTTTPDGNTQLEIKSTTKGILIPRVALSTISSFNPITNADGSTPTSLPDGLLVFNTATSGTDIVPGYYYWETDKWNKMVNSSNIAALETLTSLNYNSTANTLTYKDEEGNDTVISLTDLVEGAETLTSLNYDAPAKTLTYKDEEGNDTVVSISELVESAETLTTLNYNAVANTLTYKDEEGTDTVVDLATLVEGAETLTTLNYNAVANTLTYKDEEGADTVVDLTTLVAGAETLTTLNYNAVANTLTYKDEEGIDTVVDLATLVEGAETNTTLSIATGELVYTNEKNDNSNVSLISADTNNALISGADGRLYVDAALAVEPWFVKETTNKATSNTDNIFNMGTVGIGTNNMLGTTNTAIKLAVNGSILTTNSVYADYVFEDYFDGESKINSEYDFKSLDEVEDYINRNKHLPGVTSIKDLKRNEKGDYMVNISELSVQVLEKVEELYLHTIAQQKTIEEKEKELQKMAKNFEELSARLTALEKAAQK